MSKVVLLLGTNIGIKEDNLKTAIAELNITVGAVSLQSMVYQTDAWGNTDQEPFLNMCVMMETANLPEEVLKRILLIEKKMGRVRTEVHYEPRIMDIDILFFDDLICKSQSLTIPHEHIASRRFTLTPLVEIMPSYIHPVYKKTMRELWNDCTDTLACTPIGTL